MKTQNAKDPNSVGALPGQSSTNQLDDGMKNYASNTTNRDELLAVRQKLEAGLEFLVALLDEIDGDRDLEDDDREDDRADDEASLGWTANGAVGIHGDTDLEQDGSDSEPSLGWVEGIDQTNAHRFGLLGGIEDREECFR